MQLLSEAFGLDNRFTQELVVPKKDDKQKPLTIRSTPSAKRISKVELEEAYKKSVTAFSIVNTTVRTIFSGKPQLVCENKNVLKFFHKFLEKVGRVGNQTHWEEIHERIYRDQCIYGPAWVELIPNTRGNSIVDLLTLDPKEMDYAKTSANKIALDRYGNPIGYVQTLPNEQFIHLPKQEGVPNVIKLKGNQLFVPKERIAQFGLYHFGDGFYPIGLLEPAYSALVAKLNIQYDFAKKAKTTLFPTRVAYAGDINHEPSPENIKNLLKILKEADNNSEMSIAYYNVIKMLEPSHPEYLLNYLKFFQDLSIVSGGVPKPFVTGQAEKANKATINKLNEMYEITIRDHIARTSRGIEIKIFRRVAEMEGFETYPRFLWNILGAEEKNGKINRLLNLYDKEIIDKKQLQEMILSIEEFPEQLGKTTWQR